jgi:phage terminase large subunit
MPKATKLLKNQDLLNATGYRIKYSARGASLDIFHRRDDEILLDGPAGTGKSLSILQKLHLVMSKYPGAKGFMARKTRSSMTNSCIDMFQRHVLKPPDRVYPHKQDQVFKYPNGSSLAYFGLDEPARIMSTEFDIGYIQEATECTENDVEMCTTRLRNGVVPYQQLLMDCNPDRPTHWLLKRCQAGKTVRLQSFHKDNPRLYITKEGRWSEEGEKYLAKLQRLTGARRSRLFAGEWVAAEGLVYEEWDPQIHLISRADLPEHWREWVHYWVLDWGFIHPLVWQDWMEDPQTGVLYLNREVYKTKYLVEDAAPYVMELCRNENLPIPAAIICDHDAEDRAIFERHTGLLTLPAYKPIQAGVQAVKRRLSKDWKAGTPGIMVLRDALVEKDLALDEAGKPYCTEQEFDGYIWDENPKRDVNSKKDELPVDRNNHGMDTTRYIVAFVDNLADDPEDIEGVILNYDEVCISPL